MEAGGGLWGDMGGAVDQGQGGGLLEDIRSPHRLVYELPDNLIQENAFFLSNFKLNEMKEAS